MGSTGATGSTGAAGSITWTTISSATAAVPDHGYVITGAGSFTISLPTVGNIIEGQQIQIINAGTGAISVTPPATATIQFAGGSIPSVHQNNLTAGKVGASAPSWKSVASNYAGNVILAGAGSDVWLSKNSGATWTDVLAGNNFLAVASDGPGTHFIAAAFNGSLFTSANAGTTWMAQSSAGNGLSWRSVFSDLAGVKMVAVAQGGAILTSANSGAAWTDRTTGIIAPQQWYGVAGDQSATSLVAVAFAADIWQSSNSGVTWTNRTSGTSAFGQPWISVASDSTGMYFAACSPVNGTPANGVTSTGDLWTSKDGGITWRNRTAGTALSGKSWWSVVSDATGMRLTATINSGDTYVSSNGGATWTDITTGTPLQGAGNFVALANDMTGTLLYSAGPSTADIYGNNANANSTSSLLTGQTGSTLMLVYAGGGVYYVLDSSGNFTAY